MPYRMHGCCSCSSAATTCLSATSGAGAPGRWGAGALGRWGAGAPADNVPRFTAVMNQTTWPAGDLRNPLIPSHGAGVVEWIEPESLSAESLG
jgi:hypothetical protein